MNKRTQTIWMETESSLKKKMAFSDFAVNSAFKKVSAVWNTLHLEFFSLAQSSFQQLDFYGWI